MTGAVLTIAFAIVAVLLLGGISGLVASWVMLGVLRGVLDELKQLTPRY